MMTIQELRQVFEIKRANSKKSTEQWQTVFYMDAIDSHVRRGLDRKAGEMLYGIYHAYKTGRLQATVEMSLRDMTAYQFSTLLIDVIANCNVIADVAPFLNQHLSR